MYFTNLTSQAFCDDKKLFQKDILRKIDFKKICYTKDEGVIRSYYLILSLKRIKDRKFLYDISVSIACPPSYAQRPFDLEKVSKYNNFSYVDNITGEEKNVKVPNCQPTLEEIWENPIVSPYFRDFLKAYNPSSEKQPIDIEEVYKNKFLFYPADNFEKFLYSYDNDLMRKVKYVYKAEKMMGV